MITFRGTLYKVEDWIKVAQVSDKWRAVVNTTTTVTPIITKTIKFKCNVRYTCGGMGARRYGSIFNIGSRQKYVVTFTTRPLYPRELSLYILNRKLGWPHSRSGYLEDRKLFVPARILTPDSPVRG